MGLKNRLSEEVGASVEGVDYTIGKFRIQKQFTAGTVGSQVAMTASQTTYHVLGFVPKSAKITSVNIRATAVGVGADTKINILAVGNEVANADGVALITEIVANALVANKFAKGAIIAATSNIAANSTIVAKIVTAVSETLTPPFFDIELLL